MFFCVFQLLLKGEPFQFAKSYIKYNRVINNHIGEIEKQRLSFFSSLSYSGTNGHANYKILIKGGKSRGIVYLEMQKTLGEWKVIKGNLLLNNSRIISLGGDL